MYVENISIKNYGSIQELDFTFPFSEDGNPLPVVLLGKNGSGKTLFLSNILHSLIEFKRKCFEEITEVDDNFYYRIGSKEYIQSAKEFAYINIKYKEEGCFTDAMILDATKLGEVLAGLPNINFDDTKLKENGYYSKVSPFKKEDFNKNVYLYFPVDRYYVPQWLNTSNSTISFTNSETWLNKSNENIIKYNILESVEAWILDVIIDKYIYESKESFAENTDESGNSIIVKTQTYIGKNSTIQNLINQIVQKIFPDNDSYKNARIGISPKGNRKISIMAQDTNNQNVVLLPRFSHLSSGEIMILAIFCSILKESDRISDLSHVPFEDISGVVLIDEIDIHLHSDFAKEVVPQIMKLFPKIQFIVSSHSPFYLLGMKDVYNDDCTFLTMPTGNIMNNVENFEEIQRCYEMLDKNHEELNAQLLSAREKLENLTRPLVITEGKTDWKHIKNALGKFQERGEFREIDVSFLEYTSDMGDTQLESLLKNMAKVPNVYKIIGVFDSDQNIGKKYETVKNFTNNVYGCCIPNPYKYEFGIPIEFLYPRGELRQETSEGRRLYFSDEFSERKKALKHNKDITYAGKKNYIEDFYKRGFIQIIDNDVLAVDEENIALSKNDFASLIYERKAPFADISVEGFRGLFETISKIINNSE